MYPNQSAFWIKNSFLALLFKAAPPLDGRRFPRRKLHLGSQRFHNFKLFEIKFEQIYQIRQLSKKMSSNKGTKYKHTNLSLLPWQPTIMCEM